MAEPAGDLLERTRRSMQQTNAQDFDAALPVFSPDAVFDVTAAGVGRFEGRAAIRSYLEDWIGSYARQEYVSWEGEQLDDGVVFVVGVMSAQLAGSDARVQERWAFTVRWRAGAIEEVVADQDVEAARRAAQGARPER